MKKHTSPIYRKVKYMNMPVVDEAAIDAAITRLGENRLGELSLDLLNLLILEERADELAEDEIVNEVGLARMINPDSAQSFDLLIGIGLLRLVPTIGVTDLGRALVDRRVAAVAAVLESNDDAAILLEHMVGLYGDNESNAHTAPLVEAMPIAEWKTAIALLNWHKLIESNPKGWSPTPFGTLAIEKAGRMADMPD